MKIEKIEKKSKSDKIKKVIKTLHLYFVEIIELKYYDNKNILSITYKIQNVSYLKIYDSDW